MAHSLYIQNQFLSGDAAIEEKANHHCSANWLPCQLWYIHLQDTNQSLHTSYVVECRGTQLQNNVNVAPCQLDGNFCSSLTCELQPHLTLCQPGLYTTNAAATFRRVILSFTYQFKERNLLFVISTNASKGLTTVNAHCPARSR